MYPWVIRNASVPLLFVGTGKPLQLVQLKRSCLRVGVWGFCVAYSLVLFAPLLSLCQERLSFSGMVNDSLCHYPGIQIGSDVLNERSTALHSRVKATNALFILSGRRWRRWRLVLCFLGSWETPCLAALVSLHIPATAHRMGLRKMNALRLCAQVSTSVQIQ